MAKAAAPAVPVVEEPEPVELSELDRAKQLLLHEAKNFLGPKAEKLRARIDSSQSIEQLYDLIVKIREKIMMSDEGDSDEHDPDDD